MGLLRKLATPCAELTPPKTRANSLIMLENGMECLLISDPTTDKASAAMDVAVGHLSDPEDLQGLAHFCEHLMFMGTEKVSRLQSISDRAEES